MAGISGGADSVCLLFVLKNLCEELGMELIAVHVNHGIRGEEAMEDQRFVENLCERLGVKIRICSGKVPELAKAEKLSEEEAGRIFRRQCFEKICKEEKADKIVLAHHRDDNAETFLFHLSRGSGLKGAGGMRPVNGSYVRPLLGVGRKEIESWLEEQHISWRTDSTNLEDEYTRNRIRHQILPTLETQVNAKASEHIGAWMEQMWSLQDYVEQEVTAHMEACVERVPDFPENVNGQNGKTPDGRTLSERYEIRKEIRLRKAPLYRLHPYLRQSLVRKVLAEQAGREKDLEAVHVQQLLELFERQSGRRIDLPYNLEAIRDYEGVKIRKKLWNKSIYSENTGLNKMEREGGKQKNQEATKSDGDKKKGNCILQIPGRTAFPGAKAEIICKIIEKNHGFSQEQLPQTPYTKWFDYDIMNCNLEIRFREPGDYLVVDDSGHRQKLKSFFINEKIPAEQRSGILLVAAGKEILWIPGYRRGDSYRVKEETKKILQIELRKTEDKQNGREN